MRTITNAEIKAAALAAYDDNRLTAQAKKRADRLCRYRHGNRVCAIGAILTDEELRGVAGNASVGNVVDMGWVRFENPTFARLVQQAHDVWASARPIARKKHRLAFLQLIAP